MLNTGVLYRQWLTTLITIATPALILPTSAYPDGPPLDACVSMMPGTIIGPSGTQGHNEYSQNIFPTYGRSSRPPYYILTTAVNKTYHPGIPIEIHIVANQTEGNNYYKGILLEARKVTCANDYTIAVLEETQGTFTISPKSANTLQTLDCGAVSMSAVGHATRQLKINESVVWTPPDSNVGPVVFKATVVQLELVFWTNLYSDILVDHHGTAAPVCTANNFQALSWLTLTLTILTTATHIL